MYEMPIFAPWKTGFDKKEVTLGGSKYHPNAVAQPAAIQRVSGSSGAKPCFLYFHGGGAVGGDYTQNVPICNRVAKCGDAVVINANYRLAPEHPAPCGIEDAYAVLKDVIENGASYGVDPKKICIYGESGGGYITAGVGILLSERNEGHLVRC